MLSIFLTEDLEQELSKYNAGQLVYYFCIHKKRDKGTDLLRSLLYQIIDKRPELAKHAFTYLEMPERRAHTLSSLPSLWIILQNIIADATLGDLFCIVDGLDECDEDTRRFLIPRFVDQLEPQSSPNQPESLFRIIIVSRDLEGLEGCEKIDLDEDHASNDGGDIELFVCEKVKELFQRKKLDVVFQPTVREALISGANGTFLWVGFVINELLKVRTWSQVCKQLKSLPGDLSNIYDRMLLGIPSENRETSSLILQWVCLAQRPLKVAELAQAVGLKPAPQIICSKGIEPLPRSVLLRQTTMDEISLCGQMLKVEHEEVTLVHQSARDYLLRCDTDSNDILEFFRVRQKETRRMIARICFDIIAQNADHRITMWELCLRESEDLPLLEYATSHWEKHIQHCPDVENKLFSDLDDFFQPDSTLRAKCGLFKNVRLLIEMGANMWVKDDSGGTLLHAAVDSGSEAMVRLFLHKGLDFQAKNNARGTLLHQLAWRIAPENGIGIFRLLISLGVDINEKNHEGSTALHIGAKGNYPEIVQPLIENGANLEARNISGKTSLHFAVLARSQSLMIRDHTKTIGALIQGGADVSARDNQGYTPLDYADSLYREELETWIKDRVLN
ncbi:hypothetical protein COCVIDRAFT_109531 [Bipolaris victoriae FI3]|uniref:Uncharacterized protein n=1 Tax=Bipolaris victoriae (strain FI3) TaxID=930091 RepID=W7EG76_BIPV3|nr:hypothetical protein COCVIDRAFT_109531 [Bipolaris victoriae FI3]